MYVFDWSLPKKFCASWLICSVVFLLPFAIVVPEAKGYSVLTHEEMVDLLWKDQLVPMLRARFPRATDDDLRNAHAYAYGGSLIQDMGYYPLGSRYFSDLVHYVRAGDFVVALVNGSQNINEYAFALGALAHYAADIEGHPTVNRAVAMEFPKLQRRFGDRVNYEQNPKAHIQTEFGFDVVQVAKQRYTSDAYHDMIGFQVSRPVLERAFLKTYGIPLSDVIHDLDNSIGSFRHAVSGLVPKATKVALASMKKQMIQEDPTWTRKKFLYNLSRARYEKDFGTNYQKPGIGTRILAWILRVVPKVGPFKALAVKVPDAQVEDMYLSSVNATVDVYRKDLIMSQKKGFKLENRDFDTGNLTRAGEYKLCDDAYAKLLDQMSKRDFKDATPGALADVDSFFRQTTSGKKLQLKPEQLARVQQELPKLEAAEAAAAPGP